MSIPLLFETQNEVRRLLIAGSELAIGDFRLKKLLPQLKKAGESIPVFTRVATNVEKVVEPGPEKVSEQLLELATILHAILYTQGQSAIGGDMEELAGAPLELPTAISYRRLKPVLDALTTKGSGRLELIKAAYREGLFQDLRLVNPLISALDDNFAEIAALVADILAEYGPAIVPLLKDGVDFAGGKGQARRIELISRLAGPKEKEYYLEVVEKGSGEVKASAVLALKDLPECEEQLLDLSKDRKKEIREASLFALAYLGSDKAVNRLLAVFHSKERSLAIAPLKLSKAKEASRLLLEEGEKALELILRSEQTGFSFLAKKPDPPTGEQLAYFGTILDCLEGKPEAAVFAFLQRCLAHTKHLHQFKVNAADAGGSENTLAGMVANNIISFATPEALELLESIHGKYDNCLLAFSFAAAVSIKDPAYVFDHYARYLKKGRNTYLGQEVFRIMDTYADFSQEYRLPDFSAAGPEQWGIYKIIKDEISWDYRWVKLLADMDELSLVCRLIGEHDDRHARYLLTKLKVNQDLTDYRLKDIIRGLLQAKYPGTTDEVIRILDYNFKNKGHYLGYYISDFAQVLRLLPPESAGALEDFAVQHHHNAAAKLFEVAQDLKNKATAQESGARIQESE